jgi:predicted ATP-grasp superfamily ATP-dependent carboligase
LFRQSKSEEREVYEVKRQAMLEREELQKKVEDAKEEIDYFTTKVAKLESENKSLRLGNNHGKRIKELEDEVDALKM